MNKTTLCLFFLMPAVLTASCSSTLPSAKNENPPAYRVPKNQDPLIQMMADIPGGNQEAIREKISTAHKEKLIQDCLKEKYVSGVSYPYEFVYYHQYSFTKKDGSAVEYTDYAIRVNTPDALKKMGEQTFSFSASSERVEFLGASVYTPDSREIKTSLASVREKEPYTGLVYSDLKVKTISLQGMREGSIFRMLIKRIDKPDGRKTPIFKEIGLDHYTAVKESLYILRFEAGTDYLKKERIRGEGAESIFRKSYVAGNGDTIHIYGVSGAQTKVPEAGSIPVEEYDNRVFFLTPATWNDVAKTYYALSHPKVMVTEEISQKARLVSKDAIQRADKIKSLYDYVKGIRYVAILLNQHEIIPHEASLTLRNGYGDCKDKSVLLVAMLKAVGIESSIALVNTTSLIDKDLCSLSVFNHVIVAIPATDGSYSFLDATSPYTPYGSLPSSIQERTALVIGENSGELVMIPSQDPEKEYVEQSFEVDFQDVETATITAKSISTSSNEAFYTFRELPEPVMRQLLQSYLSQKYKDAEILFLKLDPVDQQGFLKSERKLKIGDFTKRMGNVYAFCPLADADTVMVHDIIAKAERKTDIELEGTKRLIADITIRLPDSVDAEFLPKSMGVKNVKFGEYSYRVSQIGNTIHIHRDLRTIAKRISVKDYEEFRNFYRTCILQDEEMVLLKKKLKGGPKPF